MLDCIALRTCIYALIICIVFNLSIDNAKLCRKNDIFGQIQTILVELLIIGIFQIVTNFIICVILILKSVIIYYCNKNLLMKPNYLTEYFPKLVKKYRMPIMRKDLCYNCASLLLAKL